MLLSRAWHTSAPCQVQCQPCCITCQTCCETYLYLCTRYMLYDFASHRFSHRACCARRCHLLLPGANQDGIAHAAVCDGVRWVQVLRDARQERIIRGALQVLHINECAVAPLYCFFMPEVQVLAAFFPSYINSPSVVTGALTSPGRSGSRCCPRVQF